MPIQHYRGSIQKKLTLIILLVTTLTAFAGYSSFIYWYLENQKARALDLAETVGLVIGQDVAKLILLNDVSAASDITTNLKSFTSLDSMVLYKKDKTPIYQYSKNDKSFSVKPLQNTQQKFTIEGHTLKLFIDAIYQDTNLGYVELHFHIETLWDILKRDFWIVIAIFFIMMFFSFIFASFFAKEFTKPIIKLVSFLEKIQFVDSLK